MFIEQPSWLLRWIYPKAIFRMNPTERAVYLTFDDGPIPESTPFILNTLREFQVKATFFMVGENVERYPELYNAIIADGHQVGNHTHNHLGSFKHWTTTFLMNTYRASLLIKSNLFRPPHGLMRLSVYYWLEKEFRVVMWDVVTRDYSKWMTAEDVVNNVKRYTRNGSIITFHDSLKSIDKLHYALPEVLKWLKDSGYECRLF